MHTSVCSCPFARWSATLNWFFDPTLVACAGGKAEGEQQQQQGGGEGQQQQQEGEKGEGQKQGGEQDASKSEL